MGNVEAIQQQIERLSPAELTAFRAWYAAFDAEAWDRQFEADVQTGNSMGWLMMHWAKKMGHSEYLRNNLSFDCSCELPPQ